MSLPLTAILDNAAVGFEVTCTLSPESLQVIFYALSFLEKDSSWKVDFTDLITDTERLEITELLDRTSYELLPNVFTHIFTVDTDLNTWGSDDGDFSAGVGWTSVEDPSHEIDLFIPGSGYFSPHVTITRVTVKLETTSTPLELEEHINVGVTGHGGHSVYTNTETLSTVLIVDTGYVAETDVERIFLDFFSDSSPFFISEVTVEGIGNDPF